LKRKVSVINILGDTENKPFKEYYGGAREG